MVGMLVADKTPLKPRKQMNLINRKRKNSKVGIKSDQTDSEDEESNRDHVMKKGKRIINDEDEKVEIIFPKNLTFLKRYVLVLHFITTDIIIDVKVIFIMVKLL